MYDKMESTVEVYDRLYNARAGLREYFKKRPDQFIQNQTVLHNNNRTIAVSYSNSFVR